MELRDFETRLADSRAEIDKMRLKADEAEADARARYEAELERIERERSEAESKLEALRQSGEGDMKDREGVLERALEKLGDSLRRARETLR